MILGGTDAGVSRSRPASNSFTAFYFEQAYSKQKEFASFLDFASILLLLLLLSQLSQQNACLWSIVYIFSEIGSSCVL